MPGIGILVVLLWPLIATAVGTTQLPENHAHYSAVRPGHICTGTAARPCHIFTGTWLNQVPVFVELQSSTSPSCDAERQLFWTRRIFSTVVA